jgi:tripartite-type tricarboxylate transporter receptor subunit TctC
MVTTASLVPHARSGKIKIVAVVSKKRIPALPQIPTMIESGFPELNLGSWQGIFVPKGTPKPVIDKLFRVVKQVVHDPWVGARYEKVSTGRAARDSTERSSRARRQIPETAGARQCLLRFEP